MDSGFPLWGEDCPAVLNSQLPHRGGWLPFRIPKFWRNFSKPMHFLGKLANIFKNNCEKTLADQDHKNCKFYSTTLSEGFGRCLEKKIWQRQGYMQPGDILETQRFVFKEFSRRPEIAMGQISEEKRPIPPPKMHTKPLLNIGGPVFF